MDVFKVKSYLETSFIKWKMQPFLIISMELSLTPSAKQSDKLQLPEGDT